MRFLGPTHLVVGFQHRAEAERFLKEFRERLAKFGLEMHPEKTRLIEFGREAWTNRHQEGKGKPETFQFLGFTHYCGENSKGYFTVWRETVAKRMRAKLSEIKQELRTRMHEPIAQTGKWLKQVVQGYYRYHAVPGNLRRLSRSLQKSANVFFGVDQRGVLSLTRSSSRFWRVNFHSKGLAVVAQ